MSKDMRLIPNQPGKIYAAAKTHKFYSLEDTTTQNLKFRSITFQIVTCNYNAAKALSDYLKVLPLIDEYEECLSYDVDSLFTNIPVEESVDYITCQIYTKKKLYQICSKTIIRKIIAQSDNSFIESAETGIIQTQGSSMGGPLLVTLGDIHMI